MNIEVMEAGLLAMAKKYIELMIEESEDDGQRLQREMGITYRWEYEDMELSENLIGISVGIWRGMPGDQTWDQWEHFSVNCSTDFESLLYELRSTPNEHRKQGLLDELVRQTPHISRGGA